MRVTSLGSGSSGNAFLIEAGPQGRTRLLVDAGLPYPILTARLRHAGVHPSQLQGVLITHEHGDHVVGLPTLTKRHAIPIYTAPETLAVLQHGVPTGVSTTANIWSAEVALVGGETDGWVAEKITGKISEEITITNTTSTIDASSNIA